MEKLATSIFQIEGLSTHQNELLTQAINNLVGRNASDLAFLGSEISSDFEALILQSRAALDRLTNFISRPYGKESHTDKYSKLRNIVENSKKKHENTGSILNILDNARWFERKLIGDVSGYNLRTFVAHKQSIAEKLETYFQVHHLGQDKVLLYNMVSNKLPFFKTAYEMGKNLSYLILNMLASFTTRQVFDLTYYNPNWKNRSVVLSNFTNTSSDPLRIPVVSEFTLSGFQYTEKEVDKGIVTNAISFTIALPKLVKDLHKNGWSGIGRLSNGKILLVR
jgi:hypothetical protein